MHQLTITNLAASARHKETLLFRTPDGAAGFAAKRGTMGGYIVYELDGRLMQPLPGDEVNAEQPCGDIIETRQGQVTRTWEAA